MLNFDTGSSRRGWRQYIAGLSIGLPRARQAFRLWPLDGKGKELIRRIMLRKSINIDLDGFVMHVARYDCGSGLDGTLTIQTLQYSPIEAP